MPKLINEVDNTQLNWNVTKATTWGAIILFCIWAFGSGVGCAVSSLKPTATVVVNSIVIDAQYDLAVEKFRALDLNDSERIISEDAFARLDAMRTYLKSVDSVEVGIMTLLRSQQTIDSLSASYDMLEDTYIGYIERKDLPVDPSFVVLKSRANALILASYMAVEQLELPDDRLTRISELLAYLLQGVALSKAL